MKALLFALGLLALPAFASDYAREKKWADEILPSVLTGDPVWLEQGDAPRFLGLFTEAPQAKSAVIVVHGIGVHPDWGLVSMLRQRLAETGHTTLSIQMPVLKADAKSEDYAPTFDAAGARLGRAVAFLKSKGYQKVAVASHSLGCRMSYRYLSAQPDPVVKAWAVLSTSGLEDLSRVRMPMLDLYGENDLPAVLKNAPQRLKWLGQTGSAQQRTPGADHFFSGKDEALFEAVKSFLDRTL